MATQIYDEGMRFLHTHLELSRLSVRPSSGKLRFKAAVSLKDDFKRWVESRCEFETCFEALPFRQNELTWAMKPKFHTFEHQLIELKRARPLVFSCTCRFGQTLSSVCWFQYISTGLGCSFDRRLWAFATKIRDLRTQPTLPSLLHGRRQHALAQNARSQRQRSIPGAEHHAHEPDAVCVHACKASHQQSQNHSPSTRSEGQSKMKEPLEVHSGAMTSASASLWRQKSCRGDKPQFLSPSIFDPGLGGPRIPNVYIYIYIYIYMYMYILHLEPEEKARAPPAEAAS